MKINKQLFEDVLAGKLKGTFILRNGEEINSNKLIRNNSYYLDTHPYKLIGVTYTPNGLSSLCDWKYDDDIIDFISDTNMKQNELTIEIPKGKIVDWDESKKQNKIVLKDKQLTYEDVCNALYKDKIVYFINSGGNIGNIPASELDDTCDSNNAPTKHQLECILAKNKLANVAKYLNGGWKPIKGDHVFVITYRGDFDSEPIIEERYYFGTGENLVLFRTQKYAQQAIEILGEETVKLALEPLGI